MNEVNTRLWCDPDALRNLGLAPEENVRLLGHADDNGILRTSMMQSFLPLVYNNRNYKPSFGMFEIARTVLGVREDETADEHRMLGIAMYSKEESEKKLYIKAVQLLNTIVSQLKHKKVAYEKTEVRHEWQHPKNTTKILVDGKEIGILNTLHPKTLAHIAKNAAVVCIEIDMDTLLAIPAMDLEFNEPSKYPTIEYDLSLLIPEGVRFDTISECWKKLELEILREVSVIDIYDAAGVKSVTIRLSFGLDTRTLTSEEVQAAVDAILKNMNEIGVNLKL